MSAVLTGSKPETRVLHRHLSAIYDSSYAHDDIDHDNVGAVGLWLVKQYEAETDVQQREALLKTFREIEQIILAEKQIPQVLSVRSEREQGWTNRRKPVLVTGFSTAQDDKKFLLVQQFLAERVRTQLQSAAALTQVAVTEPANETVVPEHAQPEIVSAPAPASIPVQSEDRAGDTTQDENHLKDLQKFIDDRAAEKLAAISASFAEAIRKNEGAFAIPTAEEMVRRYLVPPAHIVDVPELHPFFLATAQQQGLSDEDTGRIRSTLVQYQVASHEYRTSRDPIFGEDGDPSVAAHAERQEQVAQEAGRALRGLYLTHQTVFDLTNAKLAALPVLDSEVTALQWAEPTKHDYAEEVLRTLHDPYHAEKAPIEEQAKRVDPVIAQLYTEHFNEAGEPRNYHPKMSDRYQALLHNLSWAFWSNGTGGDSLQRSQILAESLDMPEQDITQKNSWLAEDAKEWRAQRAGLELARNSTDDGWSASENQLGVLGDTFDDDDTDAPAPVPTKSRLKSFINFALPMSVGAASGLIIRTKFAVAAAALTAPLVAGTGGAVLGAVVVGAVASVVGNAVYQASKIYVTKEQKEWNKAALFGSAVAGSAAVILPIGMGLMPGFSIAATVSGMAGAALVNVAQQAIGIYGTKTQKGWNKWSLLGSTALGGMGAWLTSAMPEFVQDLVDKVRYSKLLSGGAGVTAAMQDVAASRAHAPSLPDTAMQDTMPPVAPPATKTVTDLVPPEVMQALPERVQGFAQSGSARDQLRLLKEAAFEMSKQQGLSDDSVRGQMGLLRQAEELVNNNPELRQTIAGKQVLRDMKWLSHFALHMKPAP